MADTIEPAPLAVEREGQRLAGESIGDGPPIALLHGITATRRYVIHGSKVLARRGYRQISYDARGHGQSHPAAADDGYSFAELVADLDAVLTAEVGDRPVVLAGHSMGAHTAVSYALSRRERLAGLVVIGPTYLGFVDEEALAGWDRLADGLERGGVRGFMDAYDRGLDPAWRETILRFTERRLLEHRYPQAVARALRQVPRSAPFEAVSELEFCEVPALVVASGDAADPGHPYAVAAAYAERLPQARLIVEREGESPLAWQGGRLSREIASFCAEPAVAKRLG
ncbi:MAG TPA: alpha/beta hydrolase [Solirubrobacterales bacterium]|nr:alpha/beta hydrolase [Solirubrobacterales bacterium]